MNADTFITINAEPKSLKERWRQLVDFKELLVILAYKDIKVKYAQTMIGLLWSFINPIFTTIVITFVFYKVGKVYTGGIPHVLFTMAGMVGWTYMSGVIQVAGSSLISNQDLVKRVYFPRIFIPLAKAISSLISLVILLVCVFVLMLYFGTAPTYKLLYLPLFILMAIVTGFGLSVWVCALSIRFRDLVHAVPILLRVGMFISPIAYSWKNINGLDGWVRFFYFFNPLAGVIESIRWSLLDFHRFHPYIFISFGIAILILVTGIKYFIYVERKMADII